MTEKEIQTFATAISGFMFNFMIALVIVVNLIYFFVMKKHKVDVMTRLFYLIDGLVVVLIVMKLIEYFFHVSL